MAEPVPRQPLGRAHQEEGGKGPAAKTNHRGDVAAEAELPLQLPMMMWDVLGMRLLRRTKGPH
eukprot:978330-Prorocentrum_lima.AAC.1